jgi:SNF2 family DNA or RNA helicase
LTVPVRLTITCTLQPAYSGSTAEDIVIKTKAEAPGTPTEKFTPAGWQATQDIPRSQPKKSSANSLAIPDRRVQAHFPAALEMLGAKWDNFSQEWKLRLTKKTPEIFVLWLKSLPPEIEVLLSKELATLRDEPISGTVAFDMDEAGIDWFDLRIKLDVGDTTLTPEELKLLLNARGGYVRLGKKGWRRLQYNLSPEEDQQLARLGLHARDFSGEPQRIHALQLADDAAKKFLGPDRAEQIHRRVQELKTRVTPPLPSSIGATLRPYQTEGFHFLAYLTANRFGGVLADDMGLGKTLQTLAWLASLRETAASVQSPRPALVVCPKSVMDNWRGEAERFYPGLQVRLWDGEPAEKLQAAFAETDLLVVNYSQLRALSPQIAMCQWLAVILDEAQYIKNPDSQTAQAARALPSEHRLALTGTPIENRLLDLWSIFSFAMPGVLGNRSHFLQRFDAKDDPLARRRLSARVRPFLLRRTKTQVAKDLPDRIEEDLFCELEAEQKTLYRAELKRARQIMLGLKTDRQLNEQRFNLLTSLLRLRQICCHPALIDGDLRAAPAAKLSALEDMLEPLMAEGHKVLVFSQFVTMLDILRETVQRRDWPYFYLAGDTENRGDLVRQFQNTKGGAVFLISLKAGGFGLNLTAASYVVLFDPWWNPAVENQAIDRTHRIGQTRKVMAYRLLMRDTIEQKIRQLQKQKGALAEDVLGEERFAQSLTLNDLHFLFAD